MRYDHSGIVRIRGEAGRFSGKWGMSLPLSTDRFSSYRGNRCGESREKHVLRISSYGLLVRVKNPEIHGL